MRVSEGFVLGAITGAVVVGFWGGTRAQAAGLREVEEGAATVCDCGREHEVVGRTTATEDWSNLIVGLFGLAGRLWRWKRGRAATSAVRPSAAG